MHLTDSIEKDSLDTIAVAPEPLPCYVRDWGKKDKNDPCKVYRSLQDWVLNWVHINYSVLRWLPREKKEGERGEGERDAKK